MLSCFFHAVDPGWSNIAREVANLTTQMLFYHGGMTKTNVSAIKGGALLLKMEAWVKGNNGEVETQRWRRARAISTLAPMQ